MSPVSRTDEELLAAYRDGDHAAFEELYARFSGKVYAYLRKHLDRPEQVEDVFQRVFLKFHSARGQYDPKYSVMQWVFVIARSQLIDFVRAEKHRMAEPLDESVAAPVVNVNEEETAKLLSELVPEQKEAVRLRVLDELSYEQIAARLGRSEPSVRQLVSRALRKLRGSASERGDV